MIQARYTTVMTSKPFPTIIRRSLAKLAERPTTPTIHTLEKIDESLEPNMRALRLVMSLAEQLLSMGVEASDVVHLSLGITHTYCTRRVHMDVSSTLITLSQDRGNNREPLTLMRTMVPQDANYQSIQALQSLALAIRDQHIPLEEAERRMDELLSKPRQHPRWLICAAGGAVSAGVVVLYSGTPFMAGLSFGIGFLAMTLLGWLGRVGIPTFFSQAMVALVITCLASLVAWANASLGFAINPTLLVIGGIVLLVAGMMIVGAFQDAIDEYYITANARLLKVTMATGGIAAGVLTGLYIAQRFGVVFPATPDQLGLGGPEAQYGGALMIAAMFAVGNHARFMGMLIAGAVGVLGWWVSLVIMSWDFGVVIASGIAAALIGLTATLMSRLWRFPSMAIIGAGIVPLVPGLSLYNGLMGIVANPPGDPEFLLSLGSLAQAVMIGFAVAAGASLGNLIGRPLRRRFIRFYNRLPRRRLHQS